MVDGGAGDEGGESQEESPAERLFRLSREGRAPLGIEDTIEGIPQVPNSIDSQLRVTPPTAPHSPHPGGDPAGDKQTCRQPT